MLPRKTVSLFSHLIMKFRPLQMLRCNFADMKSRKSAVVALGTSRPVDVQETVKGMINRFLISDSFPDTLKKDLSPLSSVPPIIYGGFDPTAESLHVGNLLVITALLHFYAAGFDVIALIGGATAKLGDPSGRSNERTEIDWETLRRNSESVKGQLERIFRNFTEYVLVTPESRNRLKPIKIVNNVQWYTDMNVIRFLSEVGRRFRLKHMLQKDSVRARAATNEGMNFAEFSYQVFQAYDWLRLYEDFGCLLQVGGSDQIGNIHSGHDLIQHFHDRNAFGLTVPLLLDEKGNKLGKSTSNSRPGSAVWLDSNKTTPFEFYQHFIRLPDVEVSKYLHLFTFYPLDELDKVCSRHEKQPESRFGHTKLAAQLTLLVHGQDGLSSAERCTDALYNGTVEKVSRLSEDEFRATFAGAPALEAKFENDITVFQLAMQLGHFGNDERLALETIKNGGCSINYQKIREPNCVLVQGVHVLSNGTTVVRIGKRNYYIVVWH